MAIMLSSPAGLTLLVTIIRTLSGKCVSLKRMVFEWKNGVRCMPPYDSEDKECLVWELLEAGFWKSWPGVTRCLQWLCRIWQVGVPIVTRYIPSLEKPFLYAWKLGEAVMSVPLSMA